MDLNQIGIGIRQIREFKSIRPMQIYHDINVHPRQLEMIENNSGAYTAQTLIKVLNYLGIELTHHIDLSKLK